MATNEELLKAIAEKVEALGQSVTDAKIEEKVRANFDKLAGDKEFARKMRFAQTDPALMGSKFSRSGLGKEDLEMGYQILVAAKSRGMSHGPSVDLANAVADLSPAQPADDDGKHTRAMDTAESGYGSQLIGAQYVGSLWEAARKAAVVFPLFNTFEMNAPTAYLPVEVDMPEMLLLSESTANNSSNFTSSKTGSNRVSVTASKFGIHQMWSGEMEEDAILPYIPFLRGQAQKSLAHYSDSLLLNGDTTNSSSNINAYGADPADTKHFLAFDGLIHAAQVDNTGNRASSAGAVCSWEAALNLRKLMLDRTYLHNWGQPEDPDDLFYVADPECALKMATGIDELVTVDKYGPQAVVLNGEIAKLGRHRLLQSIAIELSDTSGYNNTTGGSNLYGRLLAVNRRGGVVGWRRQMKIETERIPATDQNRIVYTMRMGFGRFYPAAAASGIEWVAMQYYCGI
ncbi:MAG: hypothetical protein BWY10_02431 [Chloroflexi bacterium ADurb.Bin180]|nr:MAG: hypothetical protein BWY10_02431 [Chloroflexi bacterium ADurb.Bin180]